MKCLSARSAAGLAAACVSALLLAGCGGGGGGGDGEQQTLLSGSVAIGAPLVNGQVTITDRNGNVACEAEGSDLETGAEGEYQCVLKSSAEAPLVIVAIDPTGLVSPMVSLVASLPGPGESATANVSRLTTAIAAQVALNKDPLTFATDVTLLAALDTGELEAVTTNVVKQLEPMLEEVGLAASSYDPVTTPFVAGSSEGADKLLDQLVITFENGAPAMTNSMSAEPQPVALADATTAEPATVDASVSTGFSLREFDFLQAKFTSCFAAAVADRTGGDACSGLVVEDAPESLTGGASYLHNGQAADTYFGALLASEDMTGATFGAPELLRFISRSDSRNEAVVNLKFVDGKGVPDNRILVLKEYPGSETTARSSDWWLYGNQRPVNIFVQALIRQQEQMLPDSALAAFGAGPSRYQTGLNIFIAKPCATPVACPNTQGLRYVRVTGPGLPTAGLVYADVNLTTQNWMGILNTTGTIPTGEQQYASGNNQFFLQRSLGLTGDDALELRANPFIGQATPVFLEWAHPTMYGEAPSLEWRFDLGKVQAWSEYKFEFFYDGETAPRATYTTSIVTPVVPASRGATQQWHAITPETKALASDGAPAASELELAWTINPFADRITSVQAYSFANGQAVNSNFTNVPKGASSITVTAVGGTFGPLSVDTVGVRRILQFRYKVLDGSYRDQMVRFN